MTLKLHVFVAALAAVMFSASCNPANDITVPSETTGTKLLGMGVELDPHFFSQNLTRNDGSKESDWYDILVPRVKAMDIQRFRVMLQPHWWEPYNDNADPFDADLTRFTFDSPEVQSVCHVLDMAEDLGASVTLVLWGCPRNAVSVDPAIGRVGMHFLTVPDQMTWVTRSNDVEEFAENYVALIKYLKVDRGYECVKEITLYNEPDGGPISDLDTYVPEVRALEARLRKEGLRDKVRLNLSDNTDVRRWFLEGCAKNLADVADMFNSHTYIFGYETPNWKSVRWEKKNVAVARSAGKQHFVGEFGSNQCVGATRQKDINKYERGVLLVRNALNFLNAGASGASYWGLIDQYYGKDASYMEMQQLGLWRYLESAYQPEDLDPSIKGDYAVRPQFYAYSLLTRFVRKDSWVYPLDMNDSFVSGSAIFGPDHRWTYIIANGSDKDYSCSLSNTDKEGGMNGCEVYRYEREYLPEDDSMLAPCSWIEPEDGAFRLDVPSQSVIVLRQRP